jgi:hypothetical protein
MENSNTPTVAIVLAALRSKDERTHAAAVEWMARYGEDPILRLVLEATNTQHPVEYRLRVLRAIRHIGMGTHPTDFPELWRLLDDQDPEVRSAAAGLIDALGRGRKEVEEQAARSPLPGAHPSGTSGGTAASTPASAATGGSRRQARKAKP